MTKRQKRDLHGKRVYLNAWSESEAKAIVDGDDDGTIISLLNGETLVLKRSSEPLELTPHVMPLTIHSEEGEHVHGLLLQRNTRIEHPVTVAFGEEEKEISLVAEVNQLCIVS